MNILVVEDHYAVLDAMREDLEDLLGGATYCENLPDAVRQILGPWDLIIMDHDLPGDPPQTAFGKVYQGADLVNFRRTCEIEHGVRRATIVAFSALPMHNATMKARGADLAANKDLLWLKKYLVGKNE
jgi:CheY-like chemotaxis protein